jgi:hypothetical protein
MVEVLEMAQAKFNILENIKKDRENLLAISMISSLEVLKNEFGFSQEQLNKFAEKYTPTLGKNLKGK